MAESEYSLTHEAAEVVEDFVKMDPAKIEPTTPKLGHIPQLDGWRGLSILFVIACHMLPLGPKILKLNFTSGLIGMSLFFSLSGYLITSFLINRPQVVPFLIRRLFRILPLAWGYLVIMLVLNHASWDAWWHNMLFTINYAHSYVTDNMHNSHFWSLCVEVQFYLGIALIVALFGRRGLYLIPLMCIAVTVNRIVHGADATVETLGRVDEILSGAWLALIYAGWLPLPQVVRRVSPWVWCVLLFVSSYRYCEPAMYLRPYFAMLLVGSTLFQPEHRLSTWLHARWLKYVAAISYALYVWHPAMKHGWMDTGNKYVLYLLKRPVSLAAAFLMAHLSTFYWEARWTQLGRKITSSKSKSKPVATAPSAAD